MAASLVARRARLLGGSAVALVAALAGARTAQALDECGAAAPGGTVTCTPAGNSFPDGIQYKVNDLTIVVQDGVIIDTTTKAGEPGGVASGGNGNYGDLVVKAGTASGGGVTITTNENNADGISVATNDGSATITSFAAAGSLSTVLFWRPRRRERCPAWPSRFTTSLVWPARTASGCSAVLVASISVVAVRTRASLSAAVARRRCQGSPRCVKIMTVCLTGPGFRRCGRRCFRGARSSFRSDPEWPRRRRCG